MHFIRVDAEKRFLDKLAGLEDPEAKRKSDRRRIHPRIRRRRP